LATGLLVSLPSGLPVEQLTIYNQRIREEEKTMPNGRNFFRTDFGQLVLAFAGIMVASFFGTLAAGVLILAVVR
jgi:hypothetical protein